MLVLDGNQRLIKEKKKGNQAVGPVCRERKRKKKDILSGRGLSDRRSGWWLPVVLLPAGTKIAAGWNEASCNASAAAVCVTGVRGW